MDMLYWVSEYGKVFCAYIFLMFLWPSVVFSKHLRGKGKIYRFGFCVTVQVIVVNSVVLGLGLLHILNQWVVVFLFYGAFIASLLRRITPQQWRDGFQELSRLLTGTYGWKLFLYRKAKKRKFWLKNIALVFWDSIRSRFSEYVVLGMVVLYGMIYFSYGVFHDYNYGFGDMYVHHQWINGLLEGKIFYDGIYPEAMHCFIYCLYVLFGIKLYNCVLLLAGIQVSVFLVSIYVFLREIFQWKYTPIFVLAMFLTLDLMCIQEVYSMSRLQWTIPQEFSMYTQFLCVLFLVRYLRSPSTSIKEKKLWNFWKNDNLLLFMTSLAASIAIHFYSTIMAFLLCLSFVVFHLRKMLKKENFFPLVLAAICGFMISVTPMAGAFASGIPFQGSIYWAVGIMNNDDPENIENRADETSLPGEENSAEENNILEEDFSFRKKLEEVVSVLYWKGYANLYGEERADWIIGLTGLAIALWIACRIISQFQVFWSWRKREEKDFNGYLLLIVASFLFMFVYVSYQLGIPQLIDGSRICSTEQLLLLSVMAIPVDLIFVLLARLCAATVLRILSIGVTVGIYLFTIITGTYHGYLYCELTRYNAAIKVTDSIINNYPQDSYTIVSCVDELYQVNEYGRHEELLTFLQEIEKDEYKLPTEYVFIYVEKKPLIYGHSHFFGGLGWLGNGKYADMYKNVGSSQCPEINASCIEAKEAQKEMLFYERPSLSYAKIESRTILESKAYLWCQNFRKLFPLEMHIYYEDEDFVCYYFKQNPYALYNLAIDGWKQTDGIEW